MFTLRCTRPLLKRLGSLTPAGTGPEPVTTTRLGDWYANRLNIGRHRLVLCTSELSLLSVVVPAKNLPGLPERLAESLAWLLRGLGVPPELAAAELGEMQAVRFDKTKNRSVLGSMNDFAFHADAYFRGAESVAYLSELDRELAEIPAGPLDYQLPADRARELLVGAV